jgi:dihydropyrimidinase
VSRTVIKNGRVVTAMQDYVGDVLIEDEKIVAVGTIPDLQVDHEIDASGKIVMPGAIDPHTHLETPLKGTITIDDFESGTIAAAVGGTTSIIDFPVQAQGDDPRVALEEWYAKADGKAVVDWGFHQIITDLPDKYLPSLTAMADEGISSFKLFMAYPGARMVDDGTIFKAMRQTAENGGLTMMHCENGPVIDILVKEALAAGQVDPICNMLTRPPVTEGEAMARAISIAELAGVPMYAVHLSAAEALDAVARARERGVPIYAETNPQYLLLDEALMAEPDFEGAKYVLCPPLRSKRHRDELWRGLATNELQVVSTDHTPFRFSDQKQLGRGDFSKIPNGVPGIEWRLALMYDRGVRGGHFGLNRLVELVSTNAAKLFGLFPKKGDIAPGSDADIVIFDPDKDVTLRVEDQLTRCDYNPYDGWDLKGWAETVLLRGSVIVENGKFVGTKGQGQFLKRGPTMAVE